ncbi:hypothetical protein Tco_0927895 [Tanacetum coccineum]
MSMQSSSNQIGIHFLNPDKSLPFRPVEVSEFENLFLDHIHGEDNNIEDVRMVKHLRPMEELLQIPIVGIEDDIVVPAVLANEFELKIELLDFINPQLTYHLEGSDKGDNMIDSLTKEPSDTLLMGDEVISTIPERENNEFIKSSVDDLVPILRESEVTSDSDLECDMPATIPLPTTDVREEVF